ncbi:DUF397 domain-containing protein [Nocardia sp. ET3-3]|uniref:DUF397 domain-containing protein n=1 Tax=Nocardia terrae TaxID=2675851 RepID=A0A7K1UV04_9NOCA|nr:DUF397 domain-containing protein [Nocardia terrae]
MTTDLSDANWFKSSYSESGGNCVEVAFLGDGSVAIRDSKTPTAPALIFTSAEWATFTTAITTNTL